MKNQTDKLTKLTKSPSSPKPINPEKPKAKKSSMDPKSSNLRRQTKDSKLEDMLNFNNAKKSRRSSVGATKDPNKNMPNSNRKSSTIKKELYNASNKASKSIYSPEIYETNSISEIQAEFIIVLNKQEYMELMEEKARRVNFDKT